MQAAFLMKLVLNEQFVEFFVRFSTFTNHY